MQRQESITRKSCGRNSKHWRESECGGQGGSGGRGGDHVYLNLRAKQGADHERPGLLITEDGLSPAGSGEALKQGHIQMDFL